ncbi:response regulator [Enterococcus ratti]|uniref:Response regulatory domain-containing protein n=1 Tax=Enterococcus ratti TaxID=150033 RepID=A0A1L8WEH5_9ENTE|nr:response regulator [Enterococcus ratti]OJG79419.1 hypothetical protein RV14_GL000842 [Enterococcus ratti]
MIQQTIYLIDSNLFHRRIIREICLASLKKLAVQVQVKEITNLHYFHRIGISDGDIFIIDIELNDKYNGIEVSETIRKINKKCAILFLTSIEVSAAEIINKRIHPIAYLKKDLATFSSVRPKIEQVFEMIFSMKFEKNSIWTI